MKWLSRPNVAQEIFAATNSRRGAIIDWELNRMRIPEPKDFQNEGRGIRNCPLFLELRPILDEAFEIVGDKSRICVRRTSVPSHSQHGDGLEERRPTQRDDVIPALHRRFGLATIVPLDASKPANGTPTRVPAACGLFLAGQLTTDRSAELLAGY